MLEGDEMIIRKVDEWNKGESGDDVQGTGMKGRRLGCKQSTDAGSCNCNAQPQLLVLTEVIQVSVIQSRVVSQNSVMPECSVMS